MKSMYTVHHTSSTVLYVGGSNRVKAHEVEISVLLYVYIQTCVRAYVHAEFISGRGMPNLLVAGACSSTSTSFRHSDRSLAYTHGRTHANVGYRSTPRISTDGGGVGMGNVVIDALMAGRRRRVRKK